MKKTINLIALLAITVCSVKAFAGDVSALAGFYSSESKKVEGKKAGSQSSYSLGGRYHDALSANVSWFADGGIELNSYQAPEGGTSPDNSTGFLAGGGLRRYFTPFNSFTVPYAAGFGRYRAYQRVSYESSTSYTQTKYSGLYYGAAVGVRLGLDQTFFMEFEIPFFTSALFATKTEEAVTTNTTTGATTKVKSETTYTQLYANSEEGVTSMTLGVGMKL